MRVEGREKGRVKERGKKTKQKPMARQFDTNQHKKFVFHIEQIAVF